MAFKQAYKDSSPLVILIELIGKGTAVISMGNAVVPNNVLLYLVRVASEFRQS